MGKIWDKISAKKLRAAADRLELKPKRRKIILTSADRHALDGIDDLGGVTRTTKTFDGSGRIYGGPNGSFVLDGVRERDFLDRGLMTVGGQLTDAAHKALRSDEHYLAKDPRLDASMKMAGSQ